jgi:hypothetical protein
VRLLGGVLVLFRVVMANEATCGRSQEAMMTDVVSGDAADYRTLDAALGLSGCACSSNGKGQHHASKNLDHAR